jgi:hypothetical protein
LNSEEKRLLSQAIIDCDKAKLDLESLEKTFKEVMDKNKPLPLWKETPVLFGIGLGVLLTGFYIGKNNGI